MFNEVLDDMSIYNNNIKRVPGGYFNMNRFGFINQCDIRDKNQYIRLQLWEKYKRHGSVYALRVVELYFCKYIYMIVIDVYFRDALVSERIFRKNYDVDDVDIFILENVFKYNEFISLGYKYDLR